MCFIARVRDTRTVRTEDRLTFVLEPNIGVRTAGNAYSNTHVGLWLEVKQQETEET